MINLRRGIPVGTRETKTAVIIILVTGLLLVGSPVAAADETIPDWLLTPVPELDGPVVSLDCCGDGEVLCVTYTSEPYSVGFEVRNLFLGETVVLSFDWDPAENGWPGYYLGLPFDTTASPDGRKVAVKYEFTEFDPAVTTSSERKCFISILLVMDRTTGEISPVAVVDEALPVASHAFSADSRYLMADRVLECAPDHAAYMDFEERVAGLCHDIWFLPWKDVVYYDTVTRITEFRDDAELSCFDYYKCPYSDYFCNNLEHNYQPGTESGWFPFGELCRSGETGRFEYTGKDYHWVGWVRPDAALLKRDSDCVLAYVDGSSSPAPPADWVIYWWFMDDSYLFSLDGGETIRYGLIDWDEFDLDVSIELPLPAHFLDDYTIEDYVPQVGLILRGRDNSEHPGEYMRMNVGPGRVPDRIWNDR